MPRSRFSKVLTILALSATFALAGSPARALPLSDAIGWVLSWLAGTTAASAGDEGSGLDPHDGRATTSAGDEGSGLDPYGGRSH